MQKLIAEEFRGTAVNPVKFNVALLLLSSNEEKEDSADDDETFEIMLN